MPLKAPTLYPEDYKLLTDYKNLNDKIILAYLDLIRQRSEDDPSLVKVIYLDTHFMETLVKDGYTKSLQSQIDRLDIFQYDLLLVPYLVKGSWTLICVDFRQKLVVLYDSLLVLDNYCPDLAALYVVIKDEAEARNNLGVMQKIRTWQMGREETWPMQDYLHDEGVFLCMYAETLGRQVPPIFSTTDMKLQRGKILKELREKQIFEPEYNTPYCVSNAEEIMRQHKEQKKMYPVPINNN